MIPGKAEIASLLNKINGIFSFAIWDKDYRVLLLARDAIGVKPLYIKQIEAGLFFASEIKALPVSSVHLNAPALECYLTFLWSPGKQTLDADVFKLGPGEAMCISQGVIQHQFSWYQLPVFDQCSSSVPATVRRKLNRRIRALISNN